MHGANNFIHLLINKVDCVPLAQYEMGGGVNISQPQYPS